MLTKASAQWDTAFNTMPLSDLAVLSGISLPHLSQYKSGTIPMSAGTGTRLSVAAAAGPGSAILAHGLSSFPVMGAVIKQDHAVDPSWCISVLAQGYQQAGAYLQTEADIAAFHNKPVHLAHPGWQALVSGAAILSWQQCGMAGVPWWVKPSALTEPWSPIDHGKYFWQVWSTTPIVLKELNVIIGDGITKAL